MKIGIIGAGGMGGTLARRLAALGLFVLDLGGKSQGHDGVLDFP